MPKRTPPSPVFQVWERIVFESRREDGTYPPEEERAWRTLWEKHIEGASLGHTAIGDATLICRLGWSVAASHGEYAEAVRRMEHLFEHRDIGTLPAWERADHRCMIALGRLMNGEVEEAAGLYGLILGELSGKDLRNTTNIVRNHLYSYCRERTPNSVAPASLLDFAVYIIELIRGNRHLAARLQRSDWSYGRLAAALEETYPKRRSATEAPRSDPVE
jgi:hypothetical protein